MPPLKASTTLPTFIRLILTTLEPLGALNGALIGFISPKLLISEFLTRRSTPGSPEAHALAYQLAGLWILFAINEGIVMRAYDDLRLWKLLSVGMLCSDVAYLYSTAMAVGGWATLFDVRMWSVAETAAFFSAEVPLLARVWVVFGAGDGVRGLWEGKGKLKA